MFNFVCPFESVGNLIAVERTGSIIREPRCYCVKNKNMIVFEPFPKDNMQTIYAF